MSTPISLLFSFIFFVGSPWLRAEEAGRQDSPEQGESNTPGTGRVGGGGGRTAADPLGLSRLGLSSEYQDLFRQYINRSPDLARVVLRTNGIATMGELMQLMAHEARHALDGRHVPSANYAGHAVGGGMGSLVAVNGGGGMAGALPRANEATAPIPTAAAVFSPPSAQTADFARLPLPPINSYIAAHPDNADAYYVRGTILSQQENYPSALSDFSKAYELGSREPSTLISLAGAAYGVKDFPQASKFSGMALQQEPDNPVAQSIQKLAQSKVADIKPAVDLGLNDGAPDMWNLVPPTGPAAVAGKAKGTPPASEQAPPNVSEAEALRQKVLTAFRIKDYPAALTYADKLAQEEPQDPWIYYQRARIRVRMSDYNKALDDLEKALERAPENIPTQLAHALIRAKLKDHRGALAETDGVLRRRPNMAFAHFVKAYAQAGLRNRDGALESLGRAARLNPGAFGNFYNIARQEPSDLLPLFEDLFPAGAAAPAPRRHFPIPKRMAALLVTLIGGFLVAAGLLHSVSGRKRLPTTARRILGVPLGGPAQNGAGALWSQYKILREIGMGGMGVVYEAQDLGLDRRVAIKKMREEIRLDPRERTRFLSEARLVAKLRHPGIVEIYSIHEDSKEVYLIFEHVPGRTLSALLADKGPLPLKTALDFLRQAATAVEYAHRHKVVHRDIKPSNIMVNEEGTVKVMDFGIARQAQDALSRLSMTQTIAGTPPYMAPELEQGMVRPESDVYALGVCFYEMLSGELPFVGQGSGMLLNKLGGKYIPLSKRVKGLPAGLDDALAKVLAPDPDRRYKTPLEFFKAAAAAA